MSITASHSELSSKITSRGQRVFISTTLLDKRAKLFLGDKLAVTYNSEDQCVELIKSEKGTLSVTQSRGKLVVDLHNQSVKKTLGESIKTVCIWFSKGLIKISPTQAVNKACKRLNRLVHKLKNKLPLSMGSICSGFGGLDLAVKTGLAIAGITSSLAFANDYHAPTLDALVKNNTIVSEETMLFAMPMQEVPINLLPEIDILVTGLSCKPSSRCARTGKNKNLSLPEFHTEGFLALPFYAIAAATNPSIIILENVPQWAHTASAAMLENCLSTLGYKCIHVEVNSADFDVLEKRKRVSVVFATEGLELNSIEEKLAAHFEDCKTCIGDIFDYEHIKSHPTPENKGEHKNGWYPLEKLLGREQEAILKGKGHRAKVVRSMNETKISTLTSTIGRGARLDETTLLSPCGNFVRIPTPLEHVRAKGLPEHLIKDIPSTFAHQLAGNSITTKPFISLSQVIGETLLGKNEVYAPKTIDMSQLDTDINLS
jgi:DNA (cytosine-5)-methyltransferase 1